MASRMRVWVSEPVGWGPCTQQNIPAQQAPDCWPQANAREVHKQQLREGQMN